MAGADCRATWERVLRVSLMARREVAKRGGCDADWRRLPGEPICWPVDTQELRWGLCTGGIEGRGLGRANGSNGDSIGARFA